MPKKRIVVALGRNAFGKTLPEQKTAVKEAAKAIADLAELKYQIVITHSNGPQVGMIHMAMTEFGNAHQDFTVAPMAVCSAMSQGYIGYDLQNAIREELMNRGIYRTVSTVLTQVIVDPYDDAFHHPVKVIGRYMDAKEAEAEEQKGNYVKEEPGKGYRRIVAAPMPKSIVEIDAIKTLVQNDQVVIACGGGGIPVLQQGNELKGASAIIEKDYASGKLAEGVDADILMILTNDKMVDIDRDTEHPRFLEHITVEEAKEHIAADQFGVNSMLPKICASVDFITAGRGRSAIITNLENAIDALKGKTGTIITE